MPAYWILANRIHRRIWQAIRNQLPTLAAVMRPIEIRSQIVDAEAADRSVSGVVIEMRSFNLRDFAPRRQLRRSNVAPTLSPIARYPDQPVISPSPESVH